MIPFALTEREVWPACCEIAIEGELDLAVSERLRVVLDRAAAERDHVLIDLSRCEFLDGCALAVLIQAHRRLHTRGRQLLLHGVRGQVRRLLVVTAADEAGLLITTSAADAPPARWKDQLRNGASAALESA